MALCTSFFSYTVAIKYCVVKEKFLDGIFLLTTFDRQEDAQEFLSHLMDRLHEELLRFEGRSVAGQNAVVDDEEWETVGPKNRSALTRTHMAILSPLSGIFGGQLYSVVKAKGTTSFLSAHSYFS